MAKEEKGTPEEERKTFDSAIKSALRRGLEEQTGAETAETGARKRVMKPERKRTSIWRRQVPVLGTVKRRDIYAFCQQLALLLECGMPLVRALNTLANRAENPALGRLVRDIGNRVEEGSTFTDAVSRHRRQFPTLITNMFRAGEQSGTLTESLYRVADQGERLTAAKHRALVYLIYPILVLIFAIVVVTFVLGFAMNRFGELFEEWNAETPASMDFLLKLGDLFGTWSFWLILVGIVVGLIVLYKLLCRTSVFRLMRDRFLTRCPGIRHFVKEALVARFSRVFAIMLQSGVPLQDALDAAHDTTTNELMRLTISRVQDEVSRGGRLTPELERGGVFPPLAYDLSAVGEEAGSLDRVYARLADVYDQKLEMDVALVGKIIQPVIVVVLALIVGYILISFFQTYASLWQAVQTAAQ